MSPGLENEVPLWMLPSVTSSSLGEGSSILEVPMDSIPKDLSHHQFVEEWVTKLLLGETLQYGIEWEKVLGKEDPCE